jgi:hypothetical protein
MKNVITRFHSSQNPDSSENPKSMRDGKELNYFKPLEMKVVYFKIHGLVDSHGMS